MYPSHWLQGEYMKEVEVEVDNGFDECPLAGLLGFPLMVRRLACTTGHLHAPMRLLCLRR